MKYDKYSITEKINSLWEGKIKVIEDLDKYEYTTVHGKIRVKCLKCGYEYDKRINDLLHGYGCSNCAGLKRRTTEELKKEVERITKGEYKLINDAKRIRDRGKFIHTSPKCIQQNIPFEMTIQNFVNNGERCPYCNSHRITKRKISKNIKLICKELKKLKIKYILEYSFPDCRSKDNRLLPFDIYLPDYNACIEYDGEFHFKDTSFTSKESFTKNDKIKNKYCKKKGIILIRINYKDDIIKRLRKELEIKL